MSRGQLDCSNTSRSGTRATLALINEVPPTPLPWSTVRSGYVSSSKSPNGFRSVRAVFATPVIDSGNWPGCHSLPRSRMHTEGFGFRSADASRAAVIAPPYPEPTTTKSYLLFRWFQGDESMVPFPIAAIHRSSRLRAYSCRQLFVAALHKIEG